MPEFRRTGHPAAIPRAAARPGYRKLLAGLLLLALYVALRVNLLDIPLDRDEGGFALLGRTLLEGGLPYRDAIEQKPPLLFLINALALAVVPPTAAGLHLFLHAWNLLTLLVLWRLAHVAAGAMAGWLSALAYTLVSPLYHLQGFTASAEMFMLLPLALALLCAWRAADRERPAWLPLLAGGACAAIACWIKQVAFFSVLWISVWLAWQGWRQAGAAGALRCLGVWLAGGALPSLAIVLYFVARGGYPEFIYWSFVHSTLYAATADRVALLGIGLAQLLALLGGALPVVAFALLALWPGPAGCTTRRVAPFLWGALGGSCGFLLVGYAYPHYFAQLAPALALLAGLGAARLVTLCPPPHRRAAALASVLVMTGGTALLNRDYLFTRTPAATSRLAFGVNPFVESVRIAALVRAGSRPDETLFVLGSEPQIHLLAERRSATAFVFIYPAMRLDYPRAGEFERRIIAELQHTPPRYVLTSNLPTSNLWDGRAAGALVAYLEALLPARYDREAAWELHDRRWVEFHRAHGPVPASSGLPRMDLYRRRDG